MTSAKRSQQQPPGQRIQYQATRNKRQRQVLDSPQSSQDNELEQLQQGYEKHAKETFAKKQEQSRLWYIKQYFKLVSVVPDSQGECAMVKCNIPNCTSVIKYDMGAGTTSGMINHLKNIHDICVKQKEKASDSHPSNDQSKSKPYSMYSPDYIQMTRGVLYHIIKDKLSLNSVNSCGYRFLLKQANERYRPPSRCFLSTQALPALYKKCRSRLKKKMKGIGHRVAITTDGWKNIANQGFITLTARYAVITKDGLALREKLLDFRTTVGAQVANVVARQLFEQAEDTGVHISRQIPCFVTSDCGSNIRSAVSNSDKLCGISCMSHVFHRAVLECMDHCTSLPAIEKVVAMAAAFNRSIPRASAFSKWQESEGLKPLLPITVCRTRWHGYLNSIIRHLIIQQCIKGWITHVSTQSNNDNLNVDQLVGYVCTPYEMEKLQGIAYVLTHLQFYDSVAQASTQASGVKYCRVITSVLQRMSYIASYNEANYETLDVLTEKEQKITKAIVEQFDSNNSRKFRELSNKCNVTTGDFAKEMVRAVAQRFTYSQLEDILFVSFFDPQWQLSLPKWAVSRRITAREIADHQYSIKRRVVDLVKAIAPIEDELSKAGTNQAEVAEGPSGVSPSTRQVTTHASQQQNTIPSNSNPSSHPSATQNISSHHSNSPPSKRQDYLHRAPPAADMFYSSQDSIEDQKKTIKARMENMLDQQMLGKVVYHGQNHYDINWADDEQGIITEIKCYLGDKDNIMSTTKYVDPLAYWFDKRSVLPLLFNASLKVLGTPATSVLSEQVFSGAGMISCKQRATLHTQTIEKLVLLQRSMKADDIYSLTSEDLKEERRLIERSRKQRKLREAYQAAINQNSSPEQAAEVAQQVAEAYVEGNDNQLVFNTNEAFDDSEFLDGEVMTLDEGMEEINQVPIVDNIENAIEEVVQEGCKMLTRAKLRQLKRGKDTNNPKVLQEYMNDGLD